MFLIIVTGAKVFSFAIALYLIPKTFSAYVATNNTYSTILVLAYRTGS